MDKNTAKKLYNILDTLNDSLIHSTPSVTLYDSSWERFNLIMDQLASAYTDEVFSDYKVQVHDYTFGLNKIRQGVITEEFIRKLYGGTSYLHTQYLSDSTIPPSPPNGTRSESGNTYVTQHAQQNTDVTIEFNVTLAQLVEVLTKAEAEHPDETANENQFIQKLKSILPTAKNTLSIIALTLKTAQEFGLSPDQLLKILRM
jgi:hypothetical protein